MGEGEGVLRDSCEAVDGEHPRVICGGVFSPTYSGNDPYAATFGQAYLGLSVYEPGVSISSCFNIGDTWHNEHWQGPHGGFGTSVMQIMWYSWLIKLFITTLSLG